MVTTVLKVPEITSQQGGKDVTHNEALRMYDALVGNRVKTRTQTSPPLSPLNGDLHIVPASATNDWVGQDGKFGHYYNSQWYFYDTWEGATFWSFEDNDGIVFDTGNWRPLANGGKLFLPITTSLTLTSAQVGASIIQLGGSPAATFSVTMPTLEKIWLVNNGTTMTATFLTGAGGTAVIQPNTQVLIWGDGTGIRHAITGLPGGASFGGTVGLPIYSTASLPT